MGFLTEVPSRGPGRLPAGFHCRIGGSSGPYSAEGVGSGVLGCALGYATVTTIVSNHASLQTKSISGIRSSVVQAVADGSYLNKHLTQKVDAKVWK